MNQYYDPYAEQDPNYWGADSGDLMSGYSPDYNSMGYGQDAYDSSQYGFQYEGSYDPYGSQGSYDPYGGQDTSYDPYGYDPYGQQDTGYDPYGEYDPYSQDTGYDPYSQGDGWDQGSYDMGDQYGWDPYDQWSQGADYSYDDPYGYNQEDPYQGNWNEDYFNNQDPWGDYNTSEDAAPATEQGDDTQSPEQPAATSGNTDINNYKTPDLVPPGQTGPTQAETLAQAQAQTKTPLAEPPKPPWMQQIESGEAYKPYHSFANNPLPYLSQEQYNTMDPSEYEGYMALVPEWQQKDFALNMQKSWAPGRQRRSAYLS